MRPIPAVQIYDASEEPTAVDAIAKLSMQALVTKREDVTPRADSPARFLSRLRTEVLLATARLAPLMVWLLR